MKKIFKKVLIVFLALQMTGCATILGGPISASQKQKPAPGQQQRDVQVGWLIADIILFLPGLIVDFATGAIYKP